MRLAGRCDGTEKQWTVLALSRVPSGSYGPRDGACWDGSGVIGRELRDLMGMTQVRSVLPWNQRIERGSV